MSKNTNYMSGFTLVELLIVIVVIAILSVISIVAYTGVQNRAKTSTGSETASQVLNKATITYTTEGTYPAAAANFGGQNDEGKLDSSVSGNIVPGQINDADASVNGKKVGYEQCGSGTGARVTWWDFTDGAKKEKTAGTGCV